MKLTKKLLGIAAMFAVIVFMALPLTGCPDGGDDDTPVTPIGGTPNTGNTDPDPDTPITSVTITVTAPVKGGTPVTTATTSGTVHFTSAVTWSPSNRIENGQFLASEVYTATVTLTADTNYTFTGLTSVTYGQNSNSVLHLPNNVTWNSISHNYSRRTDNN